jgi:hypothetical protein
MENKGWGFKIKNKEAYTVIPNKILKLDLIGVFSPKTYSQTI